MNCYILKFPKILEKKWPEENFRFCFFLCWVNHKYFFWYHNRSNDPNYSLYLFRLKIFEYLILLTWQFRSILFVSEGFFRATSCVIFGSQFPPSLKILSFSTLSLFRLKLWGHKLFRIRFEMSWESELQIFKKFWYTVKIKKSRKGVVWRHTRDSLSHVS